MTEHDPGKPDGNAQEVEDPVDVGHPRGTMAIVLLYGLLFALGWLALYFFEFVSRGTPHP